MVPVGHIRHVRRDRPCPGSGDEDDPEQGVAGRGPPAAGEGIGAARCDGGCGGRGGSGVCWLLTGAVSAPAAAGARSAVTTVQWGKAEKVPGLAKLHKGGNAHVTSVSCGAVNDCAAGGYCADCRGHRQGFVGAERDGRWGDAVQGAPQAFVSARSHGWSARRRGGLGLPIGRGPWPISS